MLNNLLAAVSLSLTLVSHVNAAPTGNITLSTAAVASSPKGVYAHFMVGNSYSATVSTWTSNIQLAQASGIDGFALNVGRDTWQPTQVANAYQAASNLNSGFKLFLSLDMTCVSSRCAYCSKLTNATCRSLPCAGTGDATAIRNYVNTYANHPNQLYYSNQFILSSFSGENCLFGQGSARKFLLSNTTLTLVSEGNYNDGWNYAIRNGANAPVSSKLCRWNDLSNVYYRLLSFLRFSWILAHSAGSPRSMVFSK